MSNPLPIPEDPAERDLAWEGYSAWAMLPSFVICILCTTVLLFGGWFFEDIRGIGEAYGSGIFFWIAAILWMVQTIRWLYRGSTYSYRLTDQHLLIDYGFRSNRIPAIHLSSIALVEWGWTWYLRWRRVGWLRIHTKEGTKHDLCGVWHPADFAARIEQARKGEG